MLKFSHAFLKVMVVNVYFSAYPVDVDLKKSPNSIIHKFHLT